MIFVSNACGAAAPAQDIVADELQEPVEEAPVEAPPPEADITLPSPMPTQIAEVIIPDIGGGGEEITPAILESRRLTLEFPPIMRTGDSARIRLQLEVDDRGGIVPTAVIEGNVVTGEVVEIPNLYESHNVIAEARLDMAGMQIQPGGTISESLLAGQSVTFYWSVRPEESGKFQGTVWLHLRFVPKDGSEESRMPVSVQFIEIEANSFLGFLSGRTARIFGALGSVVGGVLGFPFADDFMKWLWGKFRR